MNSLELLVHLINVLVACSAMPADETKLSGQNYRIQSWTCRVDAGPVTVKAWSQECKAGEYHYWGRPFYLAIDEWHTAFYQTRFGELQSGQGAQLSDAYPPACGS